MTRIKFHHVAEAPDPVAPFSHAAECDGLVIVTGQLPIDPDEFKAPLPRGVRAQTHKTMDNLIRVLKGIGCGLDDVIGARVFLTRFERDYAAMNEVYRSYFAAGRLPARTCIGVTGLARRALVEIDFIVVRPKGKSRSKSKRVPSRR